MGGSYSSGCAFVLDVVFEHGSWSAGARFAALRRARPAASRSWTRLLGRCCTLARPLAHHVTTKKARATERGAWGDSHDVGGSGRLAWLGQPPWISSTTSPQKRGCCTPTVLASVLRHGVPPLNSSARANPRTPLSARVADQYGSSAPSLPELQLSRGSWTTLVGSRAR